MMIELYYTPEILAFYLNRYEFSEKYKMKLIHNIFHYEKAFIHPDYQNKKKLFLKKILDFTDYLYYKEELDEEIDSIQKDMDYLGYEFTNKYIIPDKPPLNFFFVTTRLKLLFTDKKRVRIKLSTLLKSYGYQSKRDKIIRYLEYCLYFYHIQVYQNNEEVKLCDVKLEEMITFKINDLYNIIGKTDNINKNIKHHLNVINDTLQGKYSKLDKITGIDSVTYTINDKLLVNFMLFTTYIKIKIHINPEILNKIKNNDLKCYVEHNYLIYYLHDSLDLENALDIIKQIIEKI